MATTPVRLPSGISYHFHVIYNTALSVHSETEDTDFSRDFVEYLVHKLESAGLKGFYHDRDSRIGRNIFNELDKLFDSSKWTIVVLTRGFIRDCWSRYLKIAAFHKVLDITNHDRVYVISVGLAKHHIPTQLVNRRVVRFNDDWEPEVHEWGKFLHSFRKYISAEDFTRLTLPLEYQHLDKQSRRSHSIENEQKVLPIYSKKSRSSPRDTYSPRGEELYSLEDDELAFETRSLRKKRNKRILKELLAIDGSDDKYYELPDVRWADEYSENYTLSYSEYDDLGYEREFTKYYGDEWDNFPTEKSERRSRHVFNDRSVTKDLYEKQNNRKKDYGNMSRERHVLKNYDETMSSKVRRPYPDAYLSDIQTQETQTPDIPELGQKHLFYIDVTDSSKSNSLKGVASPRQLVYTSFDKELVDRNYTSLDRESEHIPHTRNSTMYDSGIGVDTVEIPKEVDIVGDVEEPVLAYQTENTQDISTKTTFAHTSSPEFESALCGTPRTKNEIMRDEKPIQSKDRLHSPVTHHEEQNIFGGTKKCVIPTESRVADIGIGTNDCLYPSIADSSTDTNDLLQSVDSSIQTSNIMFNRYCNGEMDACELEQTQPDLEYTIPVSKPVRHQQMPITDKKPYAGSDDPMKDKNYKIITETDEVIQPVLSMKSHLVPSTSRNTLDRGEKFSKDTITGDGLEHNQEQYKCIDPENTKVH